MEYLSIMGHCDSAGHCGDGMGNNAWNHKACKQVQNKEAAADFVEKENKLEDSSSILAKCQSLHLREKYYQLKLG